MFAVGVIMYVLLAGVFPFPAKDAPMLLQEIQRCASRNAVKHDLCWFVGRLCKNNKFDLWAGYVI